MRGRESVVVDLSVEERGFLEAQLRRHKAARSLSCRIVLRCADGLTSKEVAAELGHSEHTIGKWRRRFAKHRIEGLSDEYRAGRPRTVSDAQVADVITRTLESTPKDAVHWSIRSMAAATGLLHTTIRRIWGAFGLQPHRSETFKLSTDPLFVDKVQDIVAFTWRRRTGPSSCAWTRNPRSRRWIGSSPYCRWRRASRSAGPIPISATTRPRYLPHSTSRPVGDRQMLQAPPRD